MPGGLTPSQVRVAATTAPWTKDFRHLQPFPRFWLKRYSFLDPNVKAARPKDRIKYWNVIPGDRVRILGDEEGRILEVSKINKITNRVYLKGTGPTVRNGIVNVHYSKCQVFIGDYEFPAKGTTGGPRTLPVFATRLGTSEPHWHPLLHRYEWDRFAASTTPRLPGHSKDAPRVRIPWPKQPDPPAAKPSPYIATADAVAEVTYKPFALPAKVTDPTPQLKEEGSYIQSLFNPQARPYDPATPVEVHLRPELSNPHGRAKKQARWKAAHVRKRALLEEHVQAALKNLKGRTRREARVEAVWKWNKQLADEQYAEKKRRWKNRGQEAKLERKKIRRARKTRKQSEKLRNLVLQEARNQVIPPAA
ncbi:hypothetical protein FA95DRAFT_1492689 [Auriscalpium vulgare]|uniref:Uncharacterized protein n=1 Tax=Auriscalpium vulgare TaxID=40419 RepID=A0ACB8RTD6_9AGAM|nr:hypothetical protein FA95DRAFT_1492689 [Auriscalpium vulgare]